MHTFHRSEQHAYRKLNTDIRSLFRNVIGSGGLGPRTLWFLLKAFYRQNRAILRRRAWEKKGVHVPAFMIVSVTTACNLRCKGCYSAALQEPRTRAMDADHLRNVLREARELGVGIVLVSGGEPLSYPGLLDILKDFPEIIFALFTNGLHIDGKTAGLFGKHRHIIPVISLEGDERETDARRGEGVFRRAAAAFGELQKRGVLFGTSLTATRANFGTIFDEEFVKGLVAAGNRLVFFVEYIPAQANTDGLVLDDEQRPRVKPLIAGFRAKFPASFFAFPFEEDDYGGCLASGRGFVHINASGDVEPCPFAPYSDRNIGKVSLREALASPVLRYIRENHDTLGQTKGGCSLWQNREQVRKELRDHEILGSEAGKDIRHTA